MLREKKTVAFEPKKWKIHWQVILSPTGLSNFLCQMCNYILFFFTKSKFLPRISGRKCYIITAPGDKSCTFDQKTNPNYCPSTSIGNTERV